MIPNKRKSEEADFINFITGTWTPILSCETESEAPEVTYTRQIGEYFKIRISESKSIVFFNVYIVCNITAVSSNSGNHAVIRGLPFKTVVNGATLNFSSFSRAVDSDHNLPIRIFS